jgi:hypothetical protein
LLYKVDLVRACRFQPGVRPGYAEAQSFLQLVDERERASG